MLTAAKHQTEKEHPEIALEFLKTGYATHSGSLNIPIEAKFHSIL